MKFNIVLGLTTILYMAPNAVAWNLPAALVGNNRLEATPTAQPSGGVEPTGTLPTGTFPSGGFGGAVPSGGFGGGAAPSGGFGGGAAPSGGFGGHHGHHGHGGGEAPSGSLPTGGPQPSGGASSFEGGVSLIGGESGEGEGQGNGGEAPVPTAASSGAPSGAPSGVPSGFPGGGFEGQSSFGSASPLPLLDPLSLALAARASMRVKAETKEMVKASNASTLARSVPYRLRSPMGYLCSFVAFSLPSTYRLDYVCLWLLAQLQSKKK
ncbi:uncharacterized protein N7469_004804 [Penicillium citrinum]|uniref:Uncharacterized protein n=1 Tax=Penicillium citrinum TaxID=5077 RepID=A0A9W9P553_PENCI|nr:uncharacterized protein N7469_004804 [Penicillium citrinum]KAJ5235636.1 hypothetical protein N7469_004804 [Penicillium citrinum]